MAESVQTQVVREALPIEQAKLDLMKAAREMVPPTLPAYQVAGMTPEQILAIQYGVQGIGAYQPYLASAGQAIGAGMGNVAEATNLLRGADTRNQFTAAQQAMAQSAVPTAQIGQAANLATAGVGLLGQGAQGMSDAQRLALASTAQPGFQQGIGTLYDAASASAKAAKLGKAPTASAAKMAATPSVSSQQVSTSPIQAAQTGFNVSGLTPNQMERVRDVSTRSLTQPGTLQQYMSPYQQAVTEIALREAQRQGDIAQQERGAAAVRAGAFGGSRQAIMEAEAARNLAQLKADIQAKGLQEAYGAASQQFNTEQQASLAAQQANQQAELGVGSQNLGALQQLQQLQAGTGAQIALANLSAEQQARVQSEANRLQAGGMNQQAALQAALANQQVGYNTALQNAQMQQQVNLANQAMQGQYGLTGAQLGQQAAQQLAAAGTGRIGATAQEAGLQQAAASLYGNLAGQQAGLAGQYANIAGAQGALLGQQAQLDQQRAAGIGSLAGQQSAIGQQLAQGIGSLGTQMSNLGVQQAALGQTGQQMGMTDVNFLYNLGQQQQNQAQAALDAQRATAMQTAMQPYQQLGFVSDIYRGAPSSQMSMTTQAAPTPSTAQQLIGTGIGAVSTAAAARRAGVF